MEHEWAAIAVVADQLYRWAVLPGQLSVSYWRAKGTEGVQTWCRSRDLNSDALAGSGV